MKIGITLTSSLHVGQEYIDLTRDIAEKLAKRGHSIVYGGTAYGMMLELAETYKNAGGKEIIGVMAKDLMAVTKRYEAYSGLDEEHLMETMGKRKEKIIGLSDAFIILPGGYGAMEELGDIFGGKVNKLYDKPIAVYNYGGFYDTLLSFFDELVAKEFSKISYQKVIFASDNFEEILEHLENYLSQVIDDKFVD